MVERTVDKKIRVLRKLLAEPIAKEESQPYTWLSPVSLEIPLSELKFIIALLGLTIVEEAQDPFSDFDIDRLIAVSVNEKVVDISSAKLKKYETNFPKRKKPQIREKTLELISQKIGNLDTGNNLVKFLLDCGVDKELIEYPNTKWRMIFDVLVYLSNSAKQEDELALSKVIGEATHPLMHSGDKSVAEALRNEFNGYLEYDNFGIAYDKDEGSYLALKNADEDIMELSAQEEWDEYERQDKIQLDFLSKPENKEKISLLRKSYQLLMNVMFFFCEDPSRPTIELNQGFQYLYKLINKTINELGLSQADVSPWSRNEHFFYLPFSNLFSAEKDCEGSRWGLNWQKLRPEMNAMYGDIEEIYQEVNGSDVLSEPDKQEKLNDIQLSLSVLKKKREIAEKILRGRADRAKSTPPTKIEITKLPELKIRGLEERVVLQKPKNKKIQLRNFPADLRWEEISIRFLNEQEVIIKARNETIQTNYDAMGFQDDKKKLPNKQWLLLRLLATKNGGLSWDNVGKLSTQEINKVKKQKQSLSENLKAFFQINNSEPFYDYKTEKEYKIKIALVPEQKIENQGDGDGDALDLKDFYNEQAQEIDDG